jgi:hypothetical protein
MNWLEIIELRSGSSNRKYIERELTCLIEELNTEIEQQIFKVYVHSGIDTDFSIHLVHESHRANINGSSLGLRLVSALKEFGLVNHSVWIEMHGK